MPTSIFRRRKVRAPNRTEGRKIISLAPEQCFPNDRDNFVSTRRYNWFTFLPYSLLFQFRKLSNCYFLAIAILVQIPGIAPVNRFSLVIPLVLVILVSELREFFEEWNASRRDKLVNEELVDLISPPPSENQTRKCKDLRPGDIVKIHRNKHIPADMLVLETSNSDGSVFIETANLDGETSLRLKRAPAITNSLGTSILSEPKSIHVTCANPNVDMYSFHGTVHLGESKSEDRIHLSNVIWRGCTVRNTEFVVGLILYSGNETRMLLNARSMGIMPSKQTSIDKQMSRNVLLIFGLQIILCVIAASIGVHSVPSSVPWYVTGTQNQRWQSLFTTYLVLLASLIPVTLWVSLEVLRVFQAWLIEAASVPGTVSPSSRIGCNSKNLHDELGNIGYVFTDKTGTLTSNQMRFVGCGIVDKIRGSVERYFIPPSAQAAAMKCILDFQGVVPPMTELVDLIIRNNPNNDDFWKCIAICHSCERIAGTNQSVSPDEAALVSMAAECGYVFQGRSDSQHIEISTGIDAIVESYQLVHEIAFTSDRKMMSLIVRKPDDGDVIVYTKGADSSVLPRCISAVCNDGIRAQVDAFSNLGYRTLCCAMKRIPSQDWHIKFQPLVSGDSSRHQAALHSMIENNLSLVGCTVVEDKLQDGVDIVLRSLRGCGIKVCMITGDKRETAINIASSCGLISNRENLYVMMPYGRMLSSGVSSPASSPVGQRNTPRGGGIFVPLNHLNDRTIDPTPVVDCSRVVLEDVVRTFSSTKFSPSPMFSLVIDGKHLKSILASPSSARQLVDVLMFDQCEAVIFCRTSPKQKGDIVALVTNYTNGIRPCIRKRQTGGTSTLAIGDGANDTNMIRLANVGVGIFGSEGSQAANTADYAIRKFSHLYDLLFIHGRWNYKRTRLFVVIFIYKNFSLALTQFWFGIVNMFSGQTAFDSTYLLLYNSVFGMVPLMILGIWDKDIDPRTPPLASSDIESTNRLNEWYESVFPNLYKNERKFSIQNVLFWCCIGILHSLVLFYGSWYGWGVSTMDTVGFPASLWMSSILAYTTEIFIVSAITLWVSSSWTKLLLWSVLIFNITAYFSFVFIYNNMNRHANGEYVYLLATSTMGNLSYWFTLAMLISIAIVPLILCERVYRMIPPIDLRDRIMRFQAVS